MAKKIKCLCGDMANVRTSKGKHSIPFMDCPTCGVLMGRKKAHIERLLRDSVDELEEKPNLESDLTTLQQSDSVDQNPPVKNSIFSGWSTVL